jgi:glucosamine kinase
VNPPLLNAAQRARAAALPFRVGVDGGGTGTRARLQDARGRTLGQGAAGPSGLSQGAEQAWRHVQQAIATAFIEADLPWPEPSTVALGLGLAGAEVVALREDFLAINPGYALALLENDGITQLAGAHGGRPGIVVSAGTGAVAAAKFVDGSLRRCGGWGWPAGDEGAGSWLGLQAMRALQNALDGRAPAGLLTRAVVGAVGPDAEAVQAWSAQAGQHACAQLAPLVFAAAEEGDPLANALLQTAADELARLADALSSHNAPGAAATGTARDLPIVLNGSIGTRLASRWPPALQARCVAPAGDSADGALLLLRAALVAP